MSKKNRNAEMEGMENSGYEGQEAAEMGGAAPNLPERKTSAMKVLEAIKAGGATNESLMELIGATKTTALYGQLSYLNTRGLNIAEVSPEMAEFPIKGEDGVYFMGTYEQFVAKKVAATPKKPTKTYTPEEMQVIAQKRFDKASKSQAHSRTKANDNPGNRVYELRAEIADKNLELASLLLEAANSGNFVYERGNVSDNAAE